MIYDGELIENYFNTCMGDLTHVLPEGPIHVDIELLERLDLLNLKEKQDTALTRYFNILETKEKITLINDQFVIWILPEYKNSSSSTLVLVALNHEGHPSLELAFIASDVYNSSKLILRILEKFLFEIQENEESLKPYLHHP